METGHIIKKIVKDSIAEELEIRTGDKLLSIDGEVLEDIFDYQYMIMNEYIELLIEKPDGEQWLLEIDKEENEDIGLEFENGLMDEYRSCHNKCIFCFIDQMPKGMRETLYFKDDDSRLSFLQGNYVTLTNMSDKDVERIIKYRLSPINISFQTTNPELRCKMLNNRFAGEALRKVDRLYEAGITMNGQIVLCKGINDGAELERSIKDLTAYLPYLESVSVVPVGLSKHREGLYTLEAFNSQDAKRVLTLIHKWQKELYDKWDLHFIHASDEWYMLAGQELPGAACYDGYLQLENGVGMMRLLLDEFAEALPDFPLMDIHAELSMATGKLAYPFIKQMTEELMERYEGLKIYVYPITNEFFGEQITVSGLLTGQDIRAQLEGQKLGSRLLLPVNVLRSEEEVFLDDFTVSELERALQVPIDIVKSSGRNFIEAILKGTVYYE